MNAETAGRGCPVDPELARGLVVGWKRPGSTRHDSPRGCRYV